MSVKLPSLKAYLSNISLIICVYWVLALPVYLFPLNYGVSGPFPRQVYSAVEKPLIFLASVYFAPLNWLLPNPFPIVFFFGYFVNGLACLLFLVLLFKADAKDKYRKLAFTLTMLGFLVWAAFFISRGTSLQALPYGDLDLRGSPK
ncbi:MAG: hypothetical protein Q8N84_04240 [bacterium]|nr:hypothetical protein [bacterium]